MPASDNFDFDPESPLLGCLAGLVAVSAEVLACALNDPDHFEMYLGADERKRLARALLRCGQFEHDIDRVVTSVIGRIHAW